MTEPVLAGTEAGSVVGAIAAGDYEPTYLAPGGASWLPTRCTPTLAGDTEDFPTDGDKLLQVIDLAWRSEESDDFELDQWQRWLIRRVLERYPDDHPKYPGQLRYRQVVISMARQNGKSILGAIFALYGLLMGGKGPVVVSVASKVEQANVIYNRVKHVIDNNPSLRKRFKATGTRGVRSRILSRPATYVVKAGAEDSLQSFTIHKCLADELHLWKPETWHAVRFGTSAIKNAQLLGITTAGDENSLLLKDLYEQGHAAVAGGEDVDERFGFFLWEAPFGCAVDDPAALIAANPAIACGRMDLDQEIQAVRKMPENQARRYRLNQFVSSEAAWLPMGLWHGAQKGIVPAGRPFVLAVSRARNWTAGTITAAAKINGRTHTEVVASLVHPTLDSLEELCLDLWRRRRPMKILMPADELKDLAMRLRERGVVVEFLTSQQMCSTAATAYSLISEGHVTHAGDPIVDTQMPRAVAKNVGDGWRISVKDSVGDVDAVIATVVGIYGAEITKPTGSMLAFG